MPTVRAAIASAAILAGGCVQALAQESGAHQASFAGDDDREDASLLTAQPILFYNMPDGSYLRSSAIWNFDLEGGDQDIPPGFGVGRAASTRR